METGMVGKSADFVVEAIGTEVGTLGKWDQLREFSVRSGWPGQCWGSAGRLPAPVGKFLGVWR